MPLTPGRYYPGSPIRLTITFVDDDGVYVDPTTVAMKTISPAGIQSSYTYNTDSNVGRIDTGQYYADITPTEFGEWLVRWQTTGTNTTYATEERFNVNYSPFYDRTPFQDYS